METPSLPHILQCIRAIPSLNPQERHVVLQELVSACGQDDLQGLRRLLKVPTAPGHDALSRLPHELVHRILYFVDAWDLIQLLAVCTSWRRILLRDATLWKEKLLQLVPAESMVIMETLAAEHCSTGDEATGRVGDTLFPSTASAGWLKTHRMLNKRSIGEGIDACTLERLRRIARAISQGPRTNKTFLKDEPAEVNREERRIRESQEEQELQTMRWRSLLTRELSVQHNWEHGQCLGDMFIVSHKDIKPVLLAWPFLFVGQGYTGVRVIHLDRLRQYFGLTTEKRPNHLSQPYHRGTSSSTTSLQEQNQHTIDIRSIPDSILFEVPHFITTLASNQHDGAGRDGAPTWGYGLMNSGIGWSDFRGTCIEPLFNLHYSATAHVAFLKHRFLSINLTGRLLLTSIDPESRRTIFAQAQIGHHGKILQVETADFEKCERLHNDEMVEWEEAIFLGHEECILILDEEARPIYEITDFDNVRRNHGGGQGSGGKLIQFQVIHDAERQEVLVLYEDALRERRRRVVSIQFEDGFSREISRQELLGDLPRPPAETHSTNEPSSPVVGGDTGPEQSGSGASGGAVPEDNCSTPQGESGECAASPLSSKLATLTTRLTSDPFGYKLPLGRGGDARDSIVMYRDRVGIVSHRFCSFELGHYCVLQVVNVRTGHGFSTDQTMESKVLHKAGLSRRGRGQPQHHHHHHNHGRGGLGGTAKRNKWWMLPIDLNSDGPFEHSGNPFEALQSEPIIVQGGQLACRILAMDHARIVLGIGATTLRIIWL